MRNHWLANLRRQLASPLLLRGGRDCTLQAYARFGPPSLFDVALPFLSTGTASIVLPGLGHLGLDPTQLIALPPLLIPQPAGVASLSVPVPNVPALAGIDVHAQALMVPWPSAPALSNVTVDTMLR